MLTFDEQLRSLNMQSKNKNASVNQSMNGETSSSNHTRKNDEVWKKTEEKSFWKKVISRYEKPNKQKENTSFQDTIVVLKPNQRVVECPVDLGCQCSYLHHVSSTSRQQIVKHSQISFNDVRMKLKNAKKLKNNRRKKSSCEIDGNDSKLEKLSVVPFSKQQEPEVFVEARRHLAERLRLVANGACEPSGSSSKRVSRTLERILLSSPKHESMAQAFGEKRLQKTPSGSSLLKQNEYSITSGLMEITDTNDFLGGRSMFSNLTSDPNDIFQAGVAGCTERTRMECSLDVSSPKADSKLENMDNDQFRENPSPVSVLESFFADNISSPTSTIDSVELQIQPRRLDFEEHSSLTSSPSQKTSMSLFAEDRGFISSYINEIYQTSQSNWEDFLATDCLLESSCDHKLLHDCVKEVLVSLHSQITFTSSKVQPFSFEKDVVSEIIEQIDWHNGLPVGPRTLDHLVRRDIAKCGKWIDVISDGNDVVFEIVDEALEELILEAIHDIHV